MRRLLRLGLAGLLRVGRCVLEDARLCLLRGAPGAIGMRAGGWAGRVRGGVVQLMSFHHRSRGTICAEESLTEAAREWTTGEIAEADVKRAYVKRA